MTAGVSAGAVLVTGVAGFTMLSVGATTPPASAAMALTTFDDCEQLRQWYVDAALPEVTAWGLGGQPFTYDGVLMSRSGALALEDAAPAATAGAVANGETGTNVQEAGVDEPDLAKTNGDLVVLLDNGDLVVYDVTGEEPVLLSRLSLPNRTRASDLLLVGDRVVVVHEGDYSWGGPMPLGDVIVRDSSYVPTQPVTALTTVDVSDPADPSIVETRTVEGTLLSAREHDGIVRVVLSSSPQLDFVQPGDGRSQKEALLENRRIVRESSAEDWLPTMTTGGIAGDSPLVSCTDVRHPDDRSRSLGTISVVTVDPSSPTDLDATAVTAAGNLVYASTDRLYVATGSSGIWGWGFDSALSQRDGGASTQIHAFSVDGTETEYVASGEVPGTVPDRWAFSEYEGTLRVASSLGNVWQPRESIVSTLVEGDGELTVTGSVGGMGENEQIQAVRWFGDIAVVVTFRQTDPLYTLDLSDITDPRVLGELKIPGFSAYLHPLGGDLVLGVGQDATSRGSQLGSQLSTFDLSDLRDPTRVATLRFVHQSFSPVENDSRSFTYLPDARLAFVPVGGWRSQDQVKIVAVGTDGQFTRQATAQIEGSAQSARALPLGDGRVAIVSGGDDVQLLDV
jgi:hypothetical protein